LRCRQVVESNYQFFRPFPRRFAEFFNDTGVSLCHTFPDPFGKENMVFIRGNSGKQAAEEEGSKGDRTEAVDDMDRIPRSQAVRFPTNPSEF
jgi:hypothetical protein